MRNAIQTLAVAGVTILGGLAFMADRPARAQNTYADVPFNQGSLFYRPSGAKPPRMTTAMVPAQTSVRVRPVRRGLFRRARMVPVVPRTVAPRPAAPVQYYYPAR